MSKMSEAVKKWRKETKRRLVESLGGKCVVCGYNRLFDALHFHHQDGSKDFSVGSVIKNGKSREKLAKEVSKCVLLCNRCHLEVHKGITEIPEDAPKFDLELFRKLNEKEINLDTEICPVCGNIKPSYKITCSVKCSNIKRRTVDWDSYNLKDMKEKGLSNVKIGEIIGVSDNAVKKRMKKLGII